VNGIWTFLVEDLRECRGRFRIAVTIQLSKHELAVGRRAIPAHVQSIVLICLIRAVTGRRHNERFDIVGPQALGQGFDIDFRASNWIGRKCERDVYYSQDSRTSVRGAQLR
jgi:hypothetical protein